MTCEQSATQLGCEEVEALLPLVAEGAISPDDDAELFAHLAACPDCQRDLALHDLTTLALSHGRSPRPADGEARCEVIRLSWPMVTGGILLAAGLGLAAWLGVQATAAPSPEERPVAATQVVDVRLDEDGNEVIVVEQNGQVIEIRRIDQGDERAESAGSASVPVGMPQRR